MNEAQRNAVTEILFALAGTGSYSWAQVMSAVNEAKVGIKNWMHVRALVQQVNKVEGLKRTADLHVEVYSK